MNSRDLRPGDDDTAEPASNEVQFALVITRMLETVKNHPEHMRQVVYDLARYKLEEQFTLADAKDVNRSKQALEAAIRGVEEFSRQPVDRPPPAAPAPAAALPVYNPPPPHLLRARELPPASSHSELDIDRGFAKARHPQWSVTGRAAVLLLLAGVIGLAIQQRERLAASLVNPLAHQDRQVATTAPAAPAAVAPAAFPPKPNPLRPTDYGVYAVVDDKSLAELQLLPGRPPDLRVQVSAAFKVPNQAALPDGHPKFIVFRRDAVNNVLARAEVRVVAKVAREFSAEATGKQPGDNDDAAIIRNFAYPFRAAPIPDNPEMYELHSEDPTLELPPGRYALILKTQAYYFSVAGDVSDPRQCIERIVTTNGTFYANCKKP
ncbi:hypothetical protein XI09_10185 [Bradyrhizobium sp. CCBAU 11386]|uniref:hypothetical protein n=1 Tax=Bradyrhizobium sp. CCBAU 11386 TaxID=1630837 RepID=UPI0023036F06|nr:hypothetical protein [Bradyrhizobium sp. CCBAU 11386]MDA9505054.1 hypothetical protein [Bradyrhizobium sp. CCBAU 11386]